MHTSITCNAVITAPILLKVVKLGDQLLLNWVTLKSAKQEPQQLELKVDNYTTSRSGTTCRVRLQLFHGSLTVVHYSNKSLRSAELPACYQNLDELVGKLRSKAGTAAQYGTHKQAESGKSRRTAAASTRQEPMPDYGAADDEFPQGALPA